MNEPVLGPFVRRLLRRDERLVVGASPTGRLGVPDLRLQFRLGSHSQIARDLRKAARSYFYGDAPLLDLDFAEIELRAAAVLLANTVPERKDARDQRREHDPLQPGDGLPFRRPTGDTGPAGERHLRAEQPKDRP